MKRSILAAALLSICCLASAQVPPDHAPYSGAREWVDGAHILPIPNKPFSAKVEIESTKTLADGTKIVRRTWNMIARDSSGRTRNEGRQLINNTDTKNPAILFYSIADPTTRMRSTVYPAQHEIRRFHLGPPPTSFPPTPQPPPGITLSKVDLGENTIDGITVHGTREIRTFGPGVAGNDKSFEVTDEFWFSPELQLNLAVIRNDPRTGIQNVRVTELSRAEPDAALFLVPPDFKVTDMGSSINPARKLPNGVTGPRRISGSEPQYTDSARHDRVQGTVLLSLVVGEDGAPRDLNVERSLRPDLDQSAVSEVSNWRFQPAMKDGKPVAMQIHIEVNFRLQ